ncbi:hypothetical protein RU07_10545 [Agrobacterium tumefaciens]|uniref:Uncharacterized protein n=1 Tax=Agrobacterium tumefaciens TaxID=358 RepID=A0A0D0KT25_AGRTU|nr:hypothetical protein RU07_10545 [Agrobacterium tumefaciens]
MRHVLDGHGALFRAEVRARRGVSNGTAGSDAHAHATESLVLIFPGENRREQGGDGKFMKDVLSNAIAKNGGMMRIA